MQHALVLDRVSKRFGDHTAVDDLSLEIPKGSIYGFIGPNGAGKTTTIRILAGLIRPTAGEVTLGGLDLRADRTRAARGLRTLVEVPSFYAGLSGKQNLEVFARLAGAERGEVDRLLDAVGLAHAAQRKVGGYSLGMRQRLGIAQALVGKPSLVVLDEPMNGLDPSAIHLVRELVAAERRERGVTFFLSSHLLHDVETLCDEVGIIHRGSMVAEGRIEDLLGDAISGYHVRTSDDPRALEALRGALVSADPRPHPDGGILLDGDEALAPALHRALLEIGMPATDVRPIRDTLERYFIEKTDGVMG